MCFSSNGCSRRAMLTIVILFTASRPIKTNQDQSRPIKTNQSQHLEQFQCWISSFCMLHKQHYIYSTNDDKYCDSLHKSPHYSQLKWIHDNLTKVHLNSIANHIDLFCNNKKYTDFRNTDNIFEITVCYTKQHLLALFFILCRILLSENWQLKTEMHHFNEHCHWVWCFSFFAIINSIFSFNCAGICEMIAQYFFPAFGLIWNGNTPLQRKLSLMKLKL